MNKTDTNQSFVVTDEEVSSMIDALSRDFETNEVAKISKSWIKAVMNQPSRKNKIKKNSKATRRSFEYSQKKFRKYLQWRTDSDVTNKIEYHLNNTVETETETETGTIGSTSSFSSVEDNTTKLITTTSPGSFYWYGIDKDGAPILWYKANLTRFEKAHVHNEMEYASLILHGVLDALPPHIHNLNFIILFDDYNPVKAMLRPNMATEFIKMLMVTCPDRLKRAVMVTGTVGHVFYNLAKGLAPSNIIDKVIVTKSRATAAQLIVEEGIMSQNKVPDFMGGTYVHDEILTMNYSAMVNAVRLAMRERQCEYEASSASSIIAERQGGEHDKDDNGI